MSGTSSSEQGQTKAAKARVKNCALQLRADPALLREIKARAGKKQVSANRFVVEAVKAALQAAREQEREQEWRAGFEAMGRDPEINTTEYALAASREILFGG